MKQMIRKMWHDQNGQDMVEYALIAGLISLAAVGAVSATGTSINGVWTAVQGAMGNAAAGN